MAENEKKAPEAEEVTAAEEVKEEQKEAAKEETAAKPAKKGKKLPLAPIIAAGAAGVLLIAALVFTIIMGSASVSAYKNKDYVGAYNKSQLALFQSKSDKNIIAEAYIKAICNEGKYYVAAKAMKKSSLSEEKKDALCAENNALALCVEGQVAVFGKYETDNKLTNGAEELEWIVLDVIEQDGRARAFIMTKDIIGVPGGWNKFDELNTDYGKSNLHDWCETDFYKTFLMSDTTLADRILLVSVETEDSSDGSDSGEAVAAHAYAPSREELKQYLKGDMEKYLIASATPAAKAKGLVCAGTDRLAAYYLRNTGVKEDDTQWAAGVDKDGVLQEGFGSNSGARVCINIDLGPAK